MFILSSFTPDFLKKPLHYLLENFSAESVSMKYVNTNIVIGLTQLQSSEERNQPVTILFRLFDLIDTNGGVINKIQLEKKLKELIEQIKQFKEVRTQPLIIALCPSPEQVYDDELKNLEKYFSDEMQANNIHILSHSDIQQHYALSDFENPVEKSTHIPYKPEFYVALSCLLARKLHCIMQQSYKVIVVDCDNTLWTGIAGDIGSANITFKEHNLALQKFLIKQKKNGVFICLCSKNEEITIDEVFSLRKEEMPLKMSDVLLKKINRDAKSSNIIAILAELKLSNAKNAMFIDDSNDEIDEVSRNLAEIYCVLMPQNLEEFNKSWSFDIDEHLSITQTDRDRLNLVKQDNSLKILSQFKDPIECLKAKRLVQPLVISKITAEQQTEIARIVQIPDRTNQFNLFPFPQDPERKMDIEDLIKKNEIDCFIATITSVATQEEHIKKENLEKEHLAGYLIKGDLTALAICKLHHDHLLVNGFFLSCRNTGLEVEYALIKYIAEYAYSKKLHIIRVQFKETEKNKLAQTFIHILCEQTNKNSAVRFLLRNTKKFPLIQSAFKSFFDTINILPIDFRRDLNKEITFEFSTNSLINLDPYLLASETLKINAKNNNFSKRLLSENDKSNAKLYLIGLQKETQSIQFLLEKFFIVSKSIRNLEDSVIDKLRAVLPDLPQDFSKDIALVYFGLDSLNAAQLSISLANKEEEGVDVDPYKLLCPKTTISSLLEYIKVQKNNQTTINSIVSSENYSEQNLKFLPVSSQQQRIWYAEQKEGVNNSSNYHMIACYSVIELDIDRFKQACWQLIKRHDIFGAKFYLDKGQLFQSILLPEDRVLAFEVRELSVETTLLSAIKEEISKPLSMTSFPLIRFIIFANKAKRNYYIFFHIHHCIFDAFSLKICLDNLSVLYKNTTTSAPSVLPIFPSYMDFIKQQNKQLVNSGFQEEAKKHYSEKFAILDEIVEFTYDKTTPKFKPTVERLAQRYSFEIEGLSVLKELAKSTGVISYSIVSSLFSILISAYTYKEKLAIITATAGREAAFFNTVGFFVNLIVQPFNLEKNKSFIEYIIENNSNFLANLDFQAYSFFEIQKILQAQDIFNVLQSPALIYQSYVSPELRLDDKMAKLILPTKPILFDMREFCRFGSLTFFAQEDEGKLSCIIEYAKDLYSDRFIKRIANNFKHLFNEVINNPQKKLHEIEVVHPEERSELLNLSKGPQLNYDENKNLVSGFNSSAKNYAEKIALCHHDNEHTYANLDRLSNNLAAKLLKKGVCKDNNVGIFLPRNDLFFITELAILKIGAVFVPLSPEDPVKRLQYIIKNADINLIVCDAPIIFSDNFSLPKLLFFSININEINRISNDEQEFLAKKNHETNKEDRACILYTSGSTGNPKGVVLQHKGLIRIVKSPNFVNVQAKDNIAQTANHVFDAAQLECWLAWMNGASLNIIDKEIVLDISLFPKQLTVKRITIMWLTAGLFHHYAYNQPNLFIHLNYLLIGGDVIEKQAVQRVLIAKGDSPLIIVNGYGPTETSIFATTCSLSLDENKVPPIGRPTNNTEIQILTRSKRLAPLGGKGQLGIMGDGLATYIYKNLQKESFGFVNEFPIYWSGDFAKWTTSDTNPQIMYLGRIVEHQQIKINGNRVDLIEIEKVLAKHPAIKQAIVLCKESSRGKKMLIVFYTKKEECTKPNKPNRQELVTLLCGELPQFMLPAAYQLIQEFPITNNGKLDRKKLLQLPLEKSLESNSTEILNNDENEVLEIFNKKFPNISSNMNINSDFHTYGIDSVELIEVIEECKKSLEKSLQGRIHAGVMYKYRSIKALAYYLSSLKKGEISKSSSLILLKEAAQGIALPTIVFIHPAGGGVKRCYQRLSEQGKFANACYGIEDPILQESKLQKLSMKQMASNYLAIIKAEITGPFILAGYSFGGMLALEIAAQAEAELENQSSRPLLAVILFDTWVVSSTSLENQAKLKEEVLIYCAEQREKANQEGKSDNLMAALKIICDHHQEIGFLFIPSRLDSTQVCLLKANKLSDNFEKMHAEKNNYLLKFVNPKLFKKKMICATHYDMLENIDKNSLIESFSELITEVTPKLSPNECSAQAKTVKLDNFSSHFSMQHSVKNASNQASSKNSFNL